MVREGKGSNNQEETKATRRTSVNAGTDWNTFRSVGSLEHVMPEVITRIVILRTTYGTGTRILLQFIDVMSAFRQVPFAPDKMAAFAYRLANPKFVDPLYSYAGAPAGRV